MLDEWRNKKRSKVWISDTLMADLNVPFCSKTSDLPHIVQAFFLGEGLPAFFLTVYSKVEATAKDLQSTESQSKTPGSSCQPAEQKAKHEEQKAKIHRVTVSAMKLLRWSLLDFCHCKFVILPLTLDMETLSVTSLREELKLRKRLCRKYYDGDLCLKAMTYKTLVSAAIALHGTSSLPYFLEMTESEVGPPF